MKYAKLVLVLLALVAAVGGAQAGAQESGPDLIRLPDGFRPEGIAISGNTFYVGSIPTGAIYRGDLRTGEGAVLFAGGAGRASIGVATTRLESVRPRPARRRRRPDRQGVRLLRAGRAAAGDVRPDDAADVRQ